MSLLERRPVTLFLAVLVVVAVAGGFVGGEITGRTFSAIGATVGVVGTAAILLGLGAYFDYQDRKQPRLTPELRGVFDRMTGKIGGPPPRKPAQQMKQSPAIPREIENAVLGLIQQDMAAAARGERPSRRLVPHHAIKRDILFEYIMQDHHDFSARLMLTLSDPDQIIQKLAPSEAKLQSRVATLNRLGHEELDEAIGACRSRADFKKIEARVRERNPLYSIVEPL